MKYMIFTMGLLFFFSSFANSFEPILVQQFSGSYDGLQGSATAKTWQMPGSNILKNVSFQVYRETDQFRLISGGDEQVFDDVPAFLLNLKNARWNEFSVDTSGDIFNVALGVLEGEDHGQKLKLASLEANCNGSLSETDFFKQLIESCTQSGFLKFRELITTQLSRSGSAWRDFWRSILLKRQKANINEVILEDLDLKISKGSFNVKIKADVDVRVTVKANGTIDYRNDEIVVKLDKVKASFLTITDKVFDELEKIQSPNIVVNRPFITISLSN